jgi:hypothetical protein
MTKVEYYKCEFCGMVNTKEKMLVHEKFCVNNPDAKICRSCVHYITVKGREIVQNRHGRHVCQNNESDFMTHGTYLYDLGNSPKECKVWKKKTSQ